MTSKCSFYANDNNDNDDDNFWKLLISFGDYYQCELKITSKKRKKKKKEIKHEYRENI